MRTSGYPHRDGELFQPALDGLRLNDQHETVKRLMADGRWRTLPEIHDITGFGEASISARLRDFRKLRFGEHTVNRRRRTAALFEYQLVLRGAVQ
jgi:hypothetical protein